MGWKALRQIVALACRQQDFLHATKAVQQREISITNIGQVLCRTLQASADAFIGGVDWQRGFRHRTILGHFTASEAALRIKSMMAVNGSVDVLQAGLRRCEAPEFSRCSGGA
ncbi:hypothetical protein C7I87_28150 [Mesorhizobium sp. SARCC-RB16n]|nr:hypothetical protein C7I87_28150 [Mesorhizobium sp. SARCC-RB16n]